MLTASIKKGFSTLKVGDQYKTQALTNIENWLTEETFKDYVPQIEHMIKGEYWDYLLDCFYQIIPFGTGGRRGEVGIGPNRINPWTIMSSAQGHSQYLLKQYGNKARSRGVVLSYDVRVFYTNRYFSDKLPNPVKNLNCKDLAQSAAKVYAANGIKVYIFDNFRTTPELSFAIRKLNAVAGDMFSASHNPPEHNGKKVYDEYGGQLIPPHDQNLVDEVTKKVKEIKTITLEQAKSSNLYQLVDKSVDEAYINACCNLSLSTNRDIKIVYTPLHGTGSTSVYKSLKQLGFDVIEDPKTSNPSGKFENVTFNIPNPEVIQSFRSALVYADKIKSDIILNSDPDADRIGIMVKHNGNWEFLNGNEIGAILTEYVIQKRKKEVGDRGVVIKTQVTSSLISKISESNNVKCIGDLLVGFKFVADEMNKLEAKDNINNFLFGCEESHGYLAGNYVRDKDATVAAIWLSELSSELKLQNKTLIDYLKEIYSKYGYFENYLTEIRLPGAEGMTQIKNLQYSLKASPPNKFGKYELERIEDWMDRKPIVSETDKAAKIGVVFYIKPIPNTTSIKVTVRPSGTEPKIKMYFEIGSKPFDLKEYFMVKKFIENERSSLEQSFMLECYRRIGVDFPKRGFLLFWQLPLKDKLKYFEIEDQIASLKNEQIDERKEKLMSLIKFLGADPIQKIDEAFKNKYKKGVLEYLDIK